MKSIYNIHFFIVTLLNKSAYYRSPDQIMDAIHSAQMSLFTEKLGNPAKYQVSHPVPPVTYQITKRISEDLRPFVSEQLYLRSGVTSPTLLINTGGEIALPDDFVYPTSFRLAKNGAEISVVDDDKVASRIGSLIAPPDAAHPIAEILHKGYRIYPDTVQSAYLKYLRLPKKPVYAMDVVGDSEVYNDTNSVDLEWAPLAHQEIIARTLPLLGLPLKDAGVIQFGQVKTQQGG